MAKEKVLIIKTGYSEFLDNEDDGREVSYGDIFRTTPILHAYSDDHVTWVTDEKAFPILKDNPLINRLLRLDWITAEHLKKERFDTIINLEKVLGICALADDIYAVRRYGFRFDPERMAPEAYDNAAEVLTVSSDLEIKRKNNKTSQELLFELVGKKWKGEGYVLGYQPKTEEQYDVALNTLVGSKWPTKAWSKEKWDDLEERLLEESFKVTRQERQDPKVLTDLYNYIDWLNSSRVIVTGDSLGLHLGLALHKRVLGLFGPTPDREVHFYGQGEAILPKEKYDCMPCFKEVCETGKKCMDSINTKNVLDKIKEQ